MSFLVFSYRDHGNVGAAVQQEPDHRIAALERREDQRDFAPGRGTVDIGVCVLKETKKKKIKAPVNIENKKGPK